MKNYGLSSLERIVPVCVGAILIAGVGAPIFAESQGSPQALVGTLEVLVEDDFETGQSKRIHLLKEFDSGTVFRLDIDGAMPTSLLSGATIVARGTAGATSILLAEDDPNSIEVIEEAAATVGARKALVLIVDFEDASVGCSESSMADMMFTGAQSVHGMYNEASFGAVSFPADTDADGQPDVARVSVDISVTETCDYYAWADIANIAAQDAGVDLNLYQHWIYVLPQETTCGWAGVANVACGDSCKAWVRRCEIPDVLAHEVGHNLGLMHSADDLDNDNVNDCSYCDRSDIMGYAFVGWRQVNGPHKAQMNWLPTEQVVDVSPNGTQTHILAPLELDPDLALYPQLLRVFRPDTNDHYYFSYRQQVGYDATLLPIYVDQINVHHYASGWVKTYFIDALDDGESFADPALGLTVTQLSHDSLSATVQLTLGPPDACAGAGGDADGDGVCGDSDNCPDTANPSQTDADGDGWGDSCESCPGDPNKLQPGACGCGTADDDSDTDGTADCIDQCPGDPAKVVPGTCGCGVVDDSSDGDEDGAPDCVDPCPDWFDPALGEDCSTVQINFAPTGSDSLAGYIEDNGGPFAADARHGWSAQLPTRERQTSFPFELETFAFTSGERRWTLELANGDYDVRVVSGDANYAQGPHRVSANGVVLLDDASTLAGSFEDRTTRVAVRGGRVELLAGGSGGLTMINLLEAHRVGTGPASLISVNFQPSGSSVPAEYLADHGDVFDPGRSYGWDQIVPASDRQSDVPQVLDTFVSTLEPRVWELELINGFYEVWLSVGDADASQGPQRVVVEGSPLIDGEPTSAGQFLERHGFAEVVDGRLTLEVGGTGGSTALNQVVVAPAVGDLDGDGWNNDTDNCPQAANADQGDADADGIGDVCDNCPAASNGGQSDADTDDLGDVCDTCPADSANDSDGDGFCADVDNCPDLANPDQNDSDADGVGDLCDPLQFTFAPSASNVPEGFERDDGSVYDTSRGFGWDHVVSTRERFTSAPSEMDTFTFSGAERQWMLELPNGDYEVTVVSGDPRYAQGPHRATVGGLTAIDDVMTEAMSFVASTIQVPVRNGLLTAAIGGTGGNTLLNSITLMPLLSSPETLVSVNFQPSGSVTPAGYNVDSGEAFDSGRGYGWNGTLPSRDRQQNQPQVLDTFVFTAQTRAWELELPNGFYEIWLSVGDASFGQGPHRAVVEGTPLIDGELTGAGQFLESHGVAQVVDGRLTVEIGGTGGFTVLNQIVLATAPPDLDGDGWSNENDNCPQTPNADQADGNGNGIGDACE